MNGQSGPFRQHACQAWIPPLGGSGEQRWSLTLIL
uniref:Uncharacterized protein n=1 Tax=Anguilla anguilla TaxID=7936 RepID=A0A0E9RV49_ANGAN